MKEPAVRYELSFPLPHIHYVEVRAELHVSSESEVELAMAVWTPGSYLIREYAKHVEGLRATDADGHELRLTKTRKNRWQIVVEDSPNVAITYRVYARQMSVQGNWVSSAFAMLNGAPTFIVPLDSVDRPFEIHVRPHTSWNTTITGLPSIGKNRFRADGWDHLIDSPIYLGNAPVHEFDAGGAAHLLVNEGEGPLWDGPASADAAAAIVRQTQEMWGTVPYDRYVFFNMIVDARGGLEHKFSTILMTKRHAMKKRKEYVDWLTLVSHEFFHTWNVKRLRPAALGPFDYENEVYTRDLWIAEGITNYYEAILVRRAGLITRKELFELLSDAIEQLQTQPGRHVQSLSDSSFDAWISLYRRDENSANTGVSYYLKGSIVALLLDVEIRRRSDDQASLDDVMREAFDRFSGARGFASAEFRAIASERATSDLSGWFARFVDGTDELDYAPLLEWFGLEMKSKDDKKKNDEKDANGWLGVVTTETDGRLLIEQVRRDTPAYQAGLNAEDEIIALDGYRVIAKEWKDRLEHHRPGEKVDVLVSRHGKLETLSLTFGEEPEKPWRVSLRDDASKQQQARLTAWIGDE